MRRYVSCAGSELQLLLILVELSIAEETRDRKKEWKPNLQPKALQEDIAEWCLVLSMQRMGGQGHKD